MKGGCVGGPESSLQVGHRIRRRIDEPGPSGGLKHAHLNMEPSGSGHIYQRIKTKNVDFSAHQIRDAGLSHAKKLGGFGLTHLDTNYVLLQSCHED